MSNTEPMDTIIIAEDSPPNRKILAHILAKFGFNVVPCENGEAAFAALNSGEHANVVMVITDLMMPVMDGLELLRAVRESEKHKNLPLVLITAVMEKDYIIRAKALNVNGYILKPVTVDRVSSKLTELFPHKKFPKLAG